jgi:hypothetical protein
VGTEFIDFCRAGAGDDHFGVSSYFSTIEMTVKN